MTSHDHSPAAPMLLGIALVLAALASVLVTRADASDPGALASARQQSVQIVRVSDHGFDWGAAGIGAAAGIGISMLAVGGALVLTGARTDPKA
jgi:apolipoprotein N-acyltransferase